MSSFRTVVLFKIRLKFFIDSIFDQESKQRDKNNFSEKLEKWAKSLQDKRVLKNLSPSSAKREYRN